MYYSDILHASQRHTAPEKVNKKWYVHFQPGIFHVFCVQDSFKAFQTIGISYTQSIFKLLLTLVETSVGELIRPLCHEFNMISTSAQEGIALQSEVQPRSSVQSPEESILKSGRETAGSPLFVCAETKKSENLTGSRKTHMESIGYFNTCFAAIPSTD